LVSDAGGYVSGRRDDGRGDGKRDALKAAAFATFSGLFEVLGAILLQFFFDDITPFIMDFMLALVAGVMVALTFIELLPSTLEVVEPKQMALSCSFGMLFMFCSQTISRQILASWFGSK